MADVNWDSDESIVVAPVSGIAVYVNVKGEVVIRQQDPMGDTDAVITFPKSHAKAIAKAINAAAKG